MVWAGGGWSRAGTFQHIPSPAVMRAHREPCLPTCQHRGWMMQPRGGREALGACVTCQRCLSSPARAAVLGERWAEVCIRAKDGNLHGLDTLMLSCVPLSLLLWLRDCRGKRSPLVHTSFSYCRCFLACWQGSEAAVTSRMAHWPGLVVGPRTRPPELPPLGRDQCFVHAVSTSPPLPQQIKCSCHVPGVDSY